MKLLEKLLYSTILFVFVYIVLSITLRMFQFTDDFASHMIGGSVATLISVLLFMYLLIKKQKK